VVTAGKDTGIPGRSQTTGPAIGVGQKKVLTTNGRQHFLYYQQTNSIKVGVVLNKYACLLKN
jgi:hypothetical protein